jgi:hypothetical protein
MIVVADPAAPNATAVRTGKSPVRPAFSRFGHISAARGLHVNHDPDRQSPGD